MRRAFVKVYTQEIEDFVKQHYKGITVPELAKLIEEEFSQPVDVGRLTSYLKLRNMSNGVDTRIGSEKWSEIRRQGFKKRDVMLRTIRPTMDAAIRAIEKEFSNKEN